MKDRANLREKKGKRTHPRNAVSTGNIEKNGKTLRSKQIQKNETGRQALEARNSELERKLHRLQEIVEDYTDQFDFAPVGYAALTEKGCIQRINITGARMLGRERPALIDMPFLPFVARSDFKKFLDHMRRCTKGNAPVSSEIRLGANGKMIDVELLSVPVLDMQQRTTVYRTVIVDITKRLLAEQALQENEQRYRDLVELSPDAIWVHRQGRFVLVNPAAVELFCAKTPQDLLGKNIVDFFQEDSRGILEKRLHRLYKGLPDMPQREEMRLKLQNSIVEVEMSASEFLYEGGPAVMIIARDIGLRKHAEILLRQAEERFSKAFHASPAAISICTLDDGRFIDVNNAFQRIFGFRRQEIIDHTAVDLRIYPNSSSRDIIIDKLREEKSIHGHETKLKTKTGWPIDVIVSLELVELAGKPCILTIWDDVTERKQLEKEILEISEREQSRVGRDLHDGICQNLAGLAFIAEGLAKNLAAETLPSAMASVEVGALAKHLKHAIDEAHNLATGLYPVRVEDNGLTSALEELASDTTRRFHISCVFKCTEPVFVWNNDSATHLYRIAQEAVSNAIKHGNAGLVKLELVATEKMIALTVEDDGKGLPKRIVRPGMGLKTMTYRARMIGGVLKISQGSRNGTVVTCSFPLQDKNHGSKRITKQQSVR